MNDEKTFNHNISPQDTAKQLAFAICDIYANAKTDTKALDTILCLCKEITEK